MRLKNIVEPIRVYMLRVGIPAGAAPHDTLTPETALSDERLPARPVVAVLPFVSLSQETYQRFLADGLAEDLITRLSYLRGLSVVSRTSSFVFRDTGKSVTEISREVGARFVLEGSIRMSGKRLRVIANLIDGETALSLWSQRYDRDLTELFEVQDEITHAIVVALQITLSDGEMALDPGGTDHYAAWEAFQKGALAHLRYTGEDHIAARRFFAEAVRIDPSFVDARVMHAWTYWQRARSGFSADRESEYAECRRQLDALLALETDTASLRHLEAATLVIERRYDEALIAAKKAVGMGPSKLFGYTPSAVARIYSGDLQGAADILRETIRTIPATPNDTVYNLAHVLLLMGDHRKALMLAEEYMRRVPTDLFAHLLLAHAQSFNGFPNRARQIIKRFRELFPTYRLSDFEAHEPFRDRSILDTLLEHLRAVGLP
jgi:adenylate cyclase